MKEFIETCGLKKGPKLYLATMYTHNETGYAVINCRIIIIKEMRQEVNI